MEKDAIRGPGWKPGRRTGEGRMPSLGGATGWLNTPPLTTDGLRGRVVVVDFWTYTCINWLRTAPYLRAWHEAYRDAGAVILGVHTPEFSFEGDADNVRRAVDDLRIPYPVAIDSDYGIWHAFDNMYWPALYVVDAQGDIRYHHFGEGAYERSERAIQQLVGADQTQPVSVEPQGIEVGADWEHQRSPETYLGAERGTNRTTSQHLTLNGWALDGEWSVHPESVQVRAGGGTLSFRFAARDLNLILAPGTSPSRFRVDLDGRPPGDDAGDDVDADGAGSVTEPRLHQLVRQHGAITERTFRITFPEPGASAYAFTFG